MLKGLDWNTSPKQVDLRQHWRLVVGMMIGMGICAIIWHCLFPHTFWFLKFWAAIPIGGQLGMFAALPWQLRDPARRKRTSGALVALVSVAWGAFTMVALFFAAPLMVGEERERSFFRSLTANDLSAVEFERGDGTKLHLSSAAQLSDFAKLLPQAELFYPSHEASLEELEVTLLLADGSVRQYHARVPEHHAADLSLQFRAEIAFAELRIPGGRRWLDQFAAKSSSHGEKSR